MYTEAFDDDKLLENDDEKCKVDLFTKERKRSTHPR